MEGDSTGGKRQVADSRRQTNSARERGPSLDTLDSLVRCPDCIDGPIPGCQWDYDHPTEWRWKTCPTCDGSGKVSTANSALCVNKEER